MIYSRDLSTEEQEYVLNLPYHLAKGGMADDLYDILIEFEFLNFKVSTVEPNSTVKPQSIIEDFDLALQEKINLVEYKKNILKIINDAIKLSANTLVDDVEQFSAQLWGRLQEYDSFDIQGFLDEARQSQQKPWLRPLKASLTKPGGNLVRTFTGHKDCVELVSVTSDGKHIISAGRDKTLKIWDIETAQEYFSLKDSSLTDCSVDALVPIGKNKLAMAGASAQSIEAGSPDSIIKIIDWKNNIEIFTTPDLENSVMCLAITKDYQNLIAGMNNGDIQIWNLESKNCTFIFPEHKIKTKDGEDYKRMPLSYSAIADPKRISSRFHFSPKNCTGFLH